MKYRVQRQVSWTPETPTKPSPSMQLVPNAANGSVETVSESKVTNDVPSAQGEATNGPPQSQNFGSGGEATHVHLIFDDADTKHGESDPLISPSPSKKRRTNSQKVPNNGLQRKPKQKVFRPKIVLDESWKKAKKATNKPQPKPKTKTKTSTPKSIPKPSTPKRSTPKPSTPKKRSDVKRAPSCKLSLLPFLDGLNEGKASFPFIGNAIVDQQGGFGSSIWKNALGSQYNLLQNYEKLTSLSSCLIQSRQVGGNFPSKCKRKRIKRGRPSLEKFLSPFKKGTRSKSFTRKKKSWVVFTIEGMTMIKRPMKSLIMKIRSLKKKKGRKTKHSEVVVYKESGANQLVPYKGPGSKKFKAEIALDEDTLREWNLIMNGKNHEESDENKQRHWEEQRNTYRCKVELFMSYMHVVQGNRSFSPWKGSVLDSVVGAYLTQNVSDHLSSSAYMSLAAKFPVKRTSSKLGIEDGGPCERHELFGSSVSSPGLEFIRDIEDIKVEETTEIPKAKEIKESSKVDNQEEKVKIFQEVDKETQERWDALRNMYAGNPKHSNNADSIDWEAVRCAKVSEIAEAIANRGQHNVIAGRIKGLLNELKDSYGTLDLEWLRHVPPMEAKEYLLNIYGMGLKSVECIRLLTLRNQAFPVDVNVGRIAVRLGWVPLQPLPEETQIHNLEKFPLFDNIQKYLWPRLCTLDPHTLYQLHYQLITFGKVFCTKKNPNCNACPMRGECRHFASACASAKVASPRTAPVKQPTDDKIVIGNHFSTSIYAVNQPSRTEQQVCKECEPIIEMPSSPEPESTRFIGCEEINDEEVCDHDASDEVLTINLSSQESSSEMQNYSTEKSKDDRNMSTSLVAFPNAGNVPAPKMKNVGRLRTERLVYVLRDGHPLLAQCIPRDPDDPYPYLLAIWTAGEIESSSESTKNSTQEEEDPLTVLGTLLIPCRTAMRGHFPLNGTYFQVNEVFADFDSMRNPIDVPRNWIWHLEKRIAYFGTGTSSIMRGLSAEQIHNCFWKGFVCVRAIDMKTGAPRPLSYNFHRNTTVRVGKENNNAQQKEG